MLDPEFFAHRAQQELHAAMKASNGRARRLHLEMADAYSAKLREAKRSRPVRATPEEKKITA